MKRIAFLLIVLISFTSLKAQEELAVNLLFPEFEQGTMLMKNGTRATGYFNYSTVTEQMLFLDEEGNPLTFKEPENINIIRIGERVFENTSKNIFYERIPLNKDENYYIRWRSKWISKGKTGAGGQSIQSASATNFQAVESSTSVPLFSNNRAMDTVFDCEFFIKKGDSFKKFNSIGSLSKLTGIPKEQLDKFAKDQKISFKDPANVIRLMDAISLQTQAQN